MDSYSAWAVRAYQANKLKISEKFEFLKQHCSLDASRDSTSFNDEMFYILESQTQEIHTHVITYNYGPKEVSSEAAKHINCPQNRGYVNGVDSVPRIYLDSTGCNDFSNNRSDRLQLVGALVFLSCLFWGNLNINFFFFFVFLLLVLSVAEWNEFHKLIKEGNSFTRLQNFWVCNNRFACHADDLCDHSWQSCRFKEKRLFPAKFANKALAPFTIFLGAFSMLPIWAHPFSERLFIASRFSAH